MLERIKYWRHYLRTHTQRPAFLWRMVLGILVAGLVIGFVVQFIPVWLPTNRVDRLAVAVARVETDDALALLDQALADPDLPFEELLESLSYLAMSRQATKSNGADSFLPNERIDPEEVISRLNASRLPSAEKEIAIGLWNSLSGPRPADGLRRLAEQTPPARYTNHALGVYWERVRAPYQAAKAYEREGQFSEASAARERAILIYIREDDTEALRRLAADPRYANSIPPLAHMQIAAAERDWWAVWWLIPRNEWERFALGSAALALFAGLCWFLFALQAGQVNLPRGARWWLCPLAVLLGMLSIWPTHLLISWQEVHWGLVPSDELPGGLRYYVLGVGLREEFSKLLLLLPLIPLLVRRDNELETLIVSACVGLGFAIIENEHYFAATFGSSTIGRFLTANFFHMSTTGLIGLSVLRGLRDPRVRGPEALAFFGVMVMAHGLYDAAIAIPALQEYSIASSIIYILLAYQFFRELRAMRTLQPEIVTLTANFLCGVSLLTAVTFVYLSAQFDCFTAAAMLVPEALSMALMAYMFLREMPNTLVTV